MIGDDVMAENDVPSMIEDSLTRGGVLAVNGRPWGDVPLRDDQNPCLF